MKEKSNKNSESSKKFFRAGFTFLALVAGSAANQKRYEMYVDTMPSSLSLGCGRESKTEFYAMRGREPSGQPISISIKSPNPIQEFIAATDGKKRYGMFEPGEDCYIHKDTDTNNSNPVFILVMRKSKIGRSECEMVRIITNLGLQACQE